MTTRQEELKKGALSLGISLEASQMETLLRYLDLLEETNKTLNLTRIPTEESVRLHLLDSLTCLPFLKDASRILDLGTGAGFPGIPIAVTAPQSSVTLLDSTLKKLRFIEEAAKQCGIVNCAILHARAETLAQEKAHSERYDAVVSRAVASFGKLMGLMLPLVKPGGIALAMKGPGFEEEMRENPVDLESFGGCLEKIQDVTLPGTDRARHLIVIRKITSARSSRKPAPARKGNS